MDVSDQHRVAFAVALFTYQLYELPQSAAVTEIYRFTAPLGPKQVFRAPLGQKKKAEHFGLLSR